VTAGNAILHAADEHGRLNTERGEDIPCPVCNEDDLEDVREARSRDRSSFRQHFRSFDRQRGRWSRPSWPQQRAHQRCSAHGQNARSNTRSSLWRVAAWCGRAAQAVGDREQDVAVGATAASLAADLHEPRQDDQFAKTKPPAESCSRILDQDLGSTRAHCSRDRPLERPGSIAGLAQGRQKGSGVLCRKP